MPVISQHTGARVVGGAAATTVASVRSSKRIIISATSSSSSSSTRATSRHRHRATVAVSSGSARRSSFLGGGASRVTEVMRDNTASRGGRLGRVGPIRPSAVVGPNEVNELAGATLLTLSGFETVLGKVSFGSLLTATSIYEYKVRTNDTERRDVSSHAPSRFVNEASQTFLRRVRG